MVIDTSGNVGIANPSPAKLLSVRSLDNATTTFAGFYALNESQGVEIGYAGIYMGGNNAAVDMNLQAKGTGDILMTGSGNVGINNTIPSEKLEVSGNIKATRVISNIIRDTNGNSQLTTTVVNASNTSTIVGNTATANTLSLGVKSSGDVLIPNGNVGIGTSTPLAKLDIQGTQGQLFSVTDNLSGSIFAVADISGVPIFDVNSSGLSTFTGNVTMSKAAPVLEISSTSGGTAQIIIGRTIDTKARIKAGDQLAGDLTFSTGGSRRLTISNGGVQNF